MTGISPAEKSRRSAYGRGIYEGLRMAGIQNPGELMNETKLARLESGLNGMAKKVLDVVPLQAPWSKDQIATEMRRIGTSADRNVIDGCLNTLCERGVVKEPTRGNFIRITARPSTPKTTAPEIAPMPEPIKTAKTIAPAAPADTLTRLAALAAGLRATAAQFSAGMHAAADELDAIALDAADEVKAAGKDGEKLRQLQALLKSLS